MAGRIFQLAVEVIVEISAELPIEVADTLVLSDAGVVALYAPLALEVSDALNLTDALTTNVGLDPKARVYQLAIEVVVEISDAVELQVALSDSLSLTDDLFVTVGIALIVEDTLSLQETSSLLGNDQLPVELSDALSFSDGGQVDFFIYAYPIFLEFVERLEFGDAAWNVPFNSEPGYTQQHGETLYLQESIFGPLEELVEVAAETLSLIEDGEVILRAAFEVQDTLFYNWAEEFKLELEQVLRFEETLSLSDALATAVVITGINVTGSDSLASLWADAIVTMTVTSPSFAESLALYDNLEVKVFGGLLLSDSLSLSDALELLASFSGVGFDDSIALTDDLQIVLTIPLQLQLSDTLALTDSVNIKRKGTDRDYLRRYLNDVRETN